MAFTVCNQINVNHPYNSLAIFPKSNFFSMCKFCRVFSCVNVLPLKHIERAMDHESGKKKPKYIKLYIRFIEFTESFDEEVSIYCMHFNSCQQSNEKFAEISPERSKISCGMFSVVS